MGVNFTIRRERPGVKFTQVRGSDKNVKLTRAPGRGGGGGGDGY